MPHDSFVHLRTHSAYSLSEGAIKPKQLVELARRQQMPAVAVTDTGNLFGAMEFSNYAKDAGVQPIIGCALPVSGVGERLPQRWAREPTVVLLVQNETGYLNLTALSSMAFLDADGEPAVPWQAVAERSEGLILLSGGPDGPVDHLFAAGRAPEGLAALSAMREAFGDRFYVELQRHGRPEEQAAEGGLVDFAYDHDVPLVATNDAYFAAADMAKAHDALLCIADGTYVGEEDRRRVTAQHWFKPAKAMRELFADLPEACDQTLDIARRTAFMVKKRNPILPRFDTGAGRDEA
jgi:DNA polymerase-3 subunit alpha